MAQEPRLTHLDERGQAHMVDVADKPVTHRRAVARGFLAMQPSTLELIVAGQVPKGDALATARIAGIMAAKRTSGLIPLCHPLSITKVSLALDPVGEPAADGRVGVAITGEVSTDGKTGVEMEALTAVAVAGLTLYDMCKAADRGMTLSEVELVSKEGGASGRWTREEE